MRHLITQLDKCLLKFEQMSLAWGIIAMAILTIANVLSRNIFSQSIFFAEEITQLLIIIVTFIGTSYAARMASHIRMSLLYDTLNPKGKKIMTILVSACSAALMFYLAYLSYEYTAKLYMRESVSPALRLPRYLFSMWAVAGFALTGIHYAITAWKNIISDYLFLGSSVIETAFETNKQKQQPTIAAKAVYPQAQE